MHLKCAWTRKSCGRGKVKHCFGLGLWSGIDSGMGFPSGVPQCYTRGFSHLERRILEIKKNPNKQLFIIIRTKNNKKPVSMGRTVGWMRREWSSASSALCNCGSCCLTGDGNLSLAKGKHTVLPKDVTLKPEARRQKWVIASTILML